VSDFPAPRRLDLSSGIALSVHEAGPEDGIPVVLCHGFPELAYSWRHQVAALAEAGFRAIAPDMRGYGRSDRPEKVEDYDLVHLSGDLVALLDALGLEKAVFAGHDWGGFVAWAMPVAHPDRTSGVIGVNTPYVPFPKTDVMRMMVGGDDEKLYILWFQEPGVADPVLQRDTRLLFEKVFTAGIDPAQAAARMMESGSLDMNPFRRLAELEGLGECILEPDELEHFVATFQETGFTGGINWYRNIDRNAELLPEIGTKPLELPCLMVTAEWDPALNPMMAAGMPALCSDLETKMIEKCGHFTQQERPDELNALMVDWLTRRKADLA
jgi:pimeloyl-ACP methyl ester carboxylesterase